MAPIEKYDALQMDEIKSKSILCRSRQRRWTATLADILIAIGNIGMVRCRKRST